MTDSDKKIISLSAYEVSDNVYKYLEHKTKYEFLCNSCNNKFYGLELYKTHKNNCDKIHIYCFKCKKTGHSLNECKKKNCIIS